MKKKITIASALLACCSAFAQIPTVDKALFLSVDVSNSIDSSEYALQKTGYVNAFASSAIQNLFTTGFSLAVKYSEWAILAPGTEVGWTIISTPLEAQAFSDALAATVRSSGIGLGTAMANGINYAGTDLAASLGVDFNLAQNGTAILDVSADGEDNEGGDVAAARDFALASGFDTINALAITNQVANLDVYMANNVQSTNGFTIQSNTFEDFEDAIFEKIFFEITGGEIPEPTTIGLLAVVGIGAFVAIRRRKSSTTAVAA
jgi:hypothetical protein